MSTLRVKRGDSAAWEFPVLKRDGVTPQPISGVTLRFTAKSDPAHADAAALIRKSTADSGVLITDGPAGLCEVHLTPAETEVLPTPGRLWWDLQLSDGSGAVWTVDEGFLIITPDITRTAP